MSYKQGLIFPFLKNLVNHGRENKHQCFRLEWGAVEKINKRKNQSGRIQSLLLHHPTPSLLRKHFLFFTCAEACSQEGKFYFPSHLHCSSFISEIRTEKMWLGKISRNRAASFWKFLIHELFSEHVLIDISYFLKLSLKCCLQPPKL